MWSYSSDYGLEKYLKKLIGRTGVADALLRLDSLTKEESLMATAKNLEVVQSVDGNVKEIKVLAKDIDDKVQVIDRVDENVKAVKERTQSFLSFLVHVPNLLPMVSKQDRMSNNVRYYSMVQSLAIQANTPHRE